MQDDPTDRLARILIDARTSGVALEPLAADLIPETGADANRVDDRVAALSGWEVAGWKIGCTSEHAQELLGSPGPFAGRVYTVLTSGAEVGPDRLAADPYLEGEFAFTIASDIGPDGPLDRDAVVASIGAVRPAIEMVGGRFADFFGTPLHLLMADAGANTLLVVGDECTDFDADALAVTAATMTVDGDRTGAGTGADVLGNPIDALCWLVGHLAERGLGVRAGQIVTTGTATQVSALPPGSTAVAAIDGFGSATVHRAPTGSTDPQPG